MITHDVRLGLHESASIKEVREALQQKATDQHTNWIDWRTFNVSNVYQDGETLLRFNVQAQVQ